MFHLLLSILCDWRHKTDQRDDCKGLFFSHRQSDWWCFHEATGCLLETAGHSGVYFNVCVCVRACKFQKDAWARVGGLKHWHPVKCWERQRGVSHRWQCRDSEGGSVLHFPSKNVIVFMSSRLHSDEYTAGTMQSVHIYSSTCWGAFEFFSLFPTATSEEENGPCAEGECWVMRPARKSKAK